MRAQADNRAVVFVASSCGTGWRGNPVMLQVDEPWAADDPLVIERPELFVDVPSVLRRSTTP